MKLKRQEPLLLQCITGGNLTKTNLICARQLKLHVFPTNWSRIRVRFLIDHVLLQAKTLIYTVRSKPFSRSGAVTDICY